MIIDLHSILAYLGKLIGEGNLGSTFSMGSISFALMFVVFLAIYTWLKGRSRMLMMLFVVDFSLLFGYKLNGALFMLVPLAAIHNYFIIERMKQHEGSIRKRLLWLVIAIDLIPLFYFKYTNFVVSDIFNKMLATNFSLPSIALLVGISFYTFQAISYAVDVYRGRFTMQVSFLEYLFYLSFFPLMMAGPITRAQNLIPRLRRNQPVSRRMVWAGVFLIIMGLLKKNFVSDYIAQYTTLVFEDYRNCPGFDNLVAIFAYPIQIYLDFSGYSDLSIGVATLMGFPLPNNFRFPYHALNMTDFWRRWHISLSTWFRDYVYIPLGGNRKGEKRTYLNNFLTMLVAGLWHGASWMFVIWGALHGVGLVVHKYYLRHTRWHIPDNLVGKSLSWVLTYIYLVITFVFFRFGLVRDSGVSDCFGMMKMAFAKNTDGYISQFCQSRMVLALVLVGSMLFYLLPERRFDRLRVRFICLPWWAKFVLFAVCVQVVIQMSQENIQPLIYGGF